MTFSTYFSPGVALQGGGGSGGGGAASLPISGNGATITASTPLIDGTQTWNNAAVTFTGAKLNITDTASNAASLLMDLQVGGASRSVIAKSGQLTVYATASRIATFGGTLPNAVRVGSTSAIGFCSAADAATADNDTILTRRGAANLRFGAADAAAPVAQTLSVQSVVAGTTNTAGTNLTITGSQGTGTGAGGSIIFQVAPAGSSGSAQNALATALTIAGSGSVVINNANAILDIQRSGVAKFAFYEDGAISQFSVNSAGIIGFTSTTTASGFNDVQLRRDAANTLALRNGTTTQTLNIYQTFIDASNYSRLSIQGTTGLGGFGITSQAAGTASIQPLRFITAGFQNIYFDTNSTTRLFIDYLGHVGTGTDNTTDLGETTLGTRRFRNIYAGTSITPGRGVTVATLPTPTTGMIARVTDATAPTIGTTVVGGGAAYALVNYNGANWTVIGV